MSTLNLAPPVPGVVTAVVIFSLVSAGLCLVLAIVLAFIDKESTKAVRDAAKKAAPRTVVEPQKMADGKFAPVEQAAHVDFVGLAKLAEGIEKLNAAGRFLIASLAFAASAAVAAGAGSIAGAVA
jgi:hypothetical protein